jgi:hypothetical protein
MKIPTIEINRVCTLKKGDSFLYDGYWREVTAITTDSIKFRTTFGTTCIKAIGNKSQLFVQIERGAT